MLTWTAPGALWLLAAVPLVWLALMAARTNFNPRQRTRAPLHASDGICTVPLMVTLHDALSPAICSCTMNLYPIVE